MRYIIAAFYIIALALFSFAPVANIVVKGIITDGNTKQPIAGASITQKGSTTATLSDAKGNFEITVPIGSILECKYVGYKTAFIKVKKSSTTLNIWLYPQVAQLDEVVVAKGYYNSLAKLQGRVPGIAIHRNKPILSSSEYRDKEEEFNTEEYSAIDENKFRSVKDAPLSTFSIDVDAASYSNIRRFLNQGQLPPAGAVRTEEMINYFHYDYPQPTAEHPFSINTEISACPWNSEHRLVMIGLQGKKIPTANLPASNLVFLIDVSGSMMDENKLPLVKSSLKLLVNQLREKDRLAIVVYAGNAGLVLPATSGSEKGKIIHAINALEAGGSTAGGEGIRLAYNVAKNNFIKEGNNRVILCTDGDFNVGPSSDADLEKMIEKERQSGVYLTVLGYGMGNYKDSKMQQLADKGNGNHAYIDNQLEAKKVLVTEFGGTLFTIAKDVKLQVEFNPEKVQAYRLIGYENRMLNKEDFNNDKKDAGELGSGHTVTALYEIIPMGVKSPFIQTVDPLKYQQENKPYASHSEEIMTIKFRYKKPDSEKSQLIEHPVIDTHVDFNRVSDNFRFASAVAEFSMLLISSEFKQNSSFISLLTRAKAALGEDAEGYRSEFLKLVHKAERIADIHAE